MTISFFSRWIPTALLAVLTALALPMATATEITGLDGTVTTLVYSPDGKTLAAADGGFDLTLWDVATGKLKFRLKGLASGTGHVAWSPDNKVIYGTSGNDWIAWDASSGVERKKVKGEMARTAPGYIAVSRDGKTLAAVGRGMLKLWETSSGRALGEYEAHPNYGINGVAFAPDGQTVATAATDRTARIASVKDGAGGATFKCQARVLAVDFSPDGKTLFATDENGGLHQFALASGEDRPAKPLPRESKQISVSSDGRWVACSGPSLQVWIRAEDRWYTEPVTDSSLGATAVAFSPDGKFLAYGDGNGRIRFWSTEKLSSKP